MGNKQAAHWEVRFYRRDSASILSKSKTVDMGRAALWAAVDAYHADMLDTDSMQLLHGARVVLTIRVVGRNDELEITRARQAADG